MSDILQGSSGGVGGLIIKKKSTSSTDDKPKKSRLGLDKLLKKIKEDSESKPKKRYDSSSSSSSDSDDEKPVKKLKRDDRVKSKSSSHYRGKYEETPTYTGGVSKDARRHKYDDRHTRYKDKYISASTKPGNDRHCYGDKDSRSDYAKRKYNDYSRSNEHNSSSQYNSERKRHKDYANEWEGSERSLYTPRSVREPSTPRLGLSNTAWDEDDAASIKNSTWDAETPVPEKHRRRGADDWSLRSTASNIKKSFGRSERRDKFFSKDGTPLGTPAYKLNSWMAKDDDEKIKSEDEDEGEKDEEEIKRLDRQWYNMDQGYDETNNPFADVSAEYEEKKTEKIAKKKKVSAKARQIIKDNELWETNRMITSGVVSKIDHDEDFEEEFTNRVHILVHNIVPPFLDGRIVFTKQPEPVVPVKDGTSDMAIVARKGSGAVKVKREQKERRKAVKKELEIAGTQLGNLMGVKVEDSKDERRLEDGTDDFKADQKFAEHMKNTDSASSKFAKTKSMSEQRKYLPAYAVKEDVLRIIRENPVVIIVGETGSGKTTQLTQYLHEDGYSKLGMVSTLIFLNSL